MIRLQPSPALKERRLSALLEGRQPRDPRWQAAVEDAQVAGSLALAGIAVTPEEVAGARADGEAPEPVRRMLRALAAVAPSSPLSLEALRAWQAAVTGGPGGLRTGDRERTGGPPPAPARFIEMRVRLLEQWLEVESGRELKAAQQGALALARIVEILPFEEANGRVARLAASHLMVRAGSRPPVLLAEDAERLEAALQAAFQLHTEPLCALLDEASERALDVMIRAVESAR